MAVGKRPAAVLAGHATTPQGSDGKRRRRIRIGSTDDYELTGVLGAGSFGIVNKARHRVTGKTVAIKSLRPTTDASELLHEARFLEACDGNPHVVRDRDTTNLCLAMEYVGPSLHAFLSSDSDKPPLSEAVVRGYMRQLLTGAKEMHHERAGIVHRDIKPANVLVGEGGKVLRFCDLGLAMSLATEKTPYGDAGTLPYMAPEMLLGKPDYCARVDTWSLGCVMAEMLAGGKRLFDFKQADGRGRDVAKIGQLWEIFTVLGLPDETTWPGFASLPLAATFPRLFLPRQHSRLGELFHEEVLSEDGFQVLQGLLECNPDKRLTAAAALQLPWFLPEFDTLLPLPGKILLPINITVVKATPKKKNLQRIKTIPPATPKMKKVRRIRNVAPTTPKKVPLFIPPAAPQKKNVLRIPLAMWKNAHLIDPCKC